MSAESTPSASATQPPSADGHTQPADKSASPFAHLFSVGSIGQLLTVAALAGYVVGLLIVNMYLYKIGVSDFSVLRTRFVLTGFLATLPLLAFANIALAVVTAVVGFREGRRLGNDKRRDKFHTSLIVVTVLNFFVLIAAMVWDWIDRSNINFRSDFYAALGLDTDLIFIFLILVPMVVSVSLSRWVLAGESYYRRPLALQVWGMLFGVLLQVGFFGFLYIDFFASTFYPLIPEQFGGGKPKEVVIVLAPESNALGTTLGFAPASDGPITLQVDLLWETEQMYVFRDRNLPDAPIVQIDRDEVRAVVLGSSIEPVATPIASPLATP